MFLLFLIGKTKIIHTLMLYFNSCDQLIRIINFKTHASFLASSIVFLQNEWQQESSRYRSALIRIVKIQASFLPVSFQASCLDVFNVMLPSPFSFKSRAFFFVRVRHGVRQYLVEYFWYFRSAIRTDRQQHQFSSSCHKLLILRYFII